MIVLDPTAGGGSIPFEALRLGHTVIANDINPVATVILHATLNDPAQFGPELVKEIQEWGESTPYYSQKPLMGFIQIASLSQGRTAYSAKINCFVP